MSEAGLSGAQTKMRAAGVGDVAIKAFTHYYQQLVDGASGIVAEAEIAPLVDPARLGDVAVSDAQARDAMAQLVFVKLNGGLGTSMGLAKAKSLLEVRDGKTFLDIVVQQVLAAREHYGVALPLLLMNSFRTQQDSLDALAKYPQLAVDGLPLDFLQSQEPKLLASDLTAVNWPTDPSLEWCPPGHGDLYPSLLDSGLLDLLIAAGYRYASVSNSDNLGAIPDARLAAWFAGTGAPFAMEVCRRTINDQKGGHLARRVTDGRVILREAAQTAAGNMDAFTDIERHRFFNTNNLWLNLPALKQALADKGSVLGLPLIRNEKHVDPADPSSPKVIQVESAMGAAVETFEGSAVIQVERDRFVPVKKTNELLLLRSDRYVIDQDGILNAQGGPEPAIDLDPTFFAMVDDFEQRVPHPIGLLDATSLQVRGDWTFGKDVQVVGDVDLTASAGHSHQVPDGQVLRGER